MFALFFLRCSAIFLQICAWFSWIWRFLGPIFHFYKFVKDAYCSCLLIAGIWFQIFVNFQLQAEEPMAQFGCSREECTACVCRFLSFCLFLLRTIWKLHSEQNHCEQRIGLVEFHLVLYLVARFAFPQNVFVSDDCSFGIFGWQSWIFEKCGELMHIS